MSINKHKLKSVIFIWQTQLTSTWISTNCPRDKSRVMIRFSNLAFPQAVSCLPHISEARVQSQENPCGICGGQSGTENGCLKVILFSSTVLFHRGPTRIHSTITNAIESYQLTASLSNINRYSDSKRHGVDKEMKILRVDTQWMMSWSTSRGRIGIAL
jgi:hypothetical protein